MDQNLLVLLAILPGLLIAGLVWWLDKNKEDSRNIVGFFFLGMIITAPVYIFQELSYKIGLDVSTEIGMTFLFAFGVIAFTEELMKFVVMRYYLFSKPFFDEPMDGVVYGAMLAMGFATIENILYAIDLGLETAILRMFTSVPAHGVFGILMGYFIGKAKFEKTNRTRNLVLAFVVPFLLHGLFDFCILQQNYDLLRGASLLVLLGGIIASGIAIYTLRKGSVVMPVQPNISDQVTAESSQTLDPETTTIEDDPISIQDAFDVETPIAIEDSAAALPTEELLASKPTIEIPKAGTTVPPAPKEAIAAPEPTIPEPPKPLEIQDSKAIEKSLAELESELEDMRDDLEEDEESDV